MATGNKSDGRDSVDGVRIGREGRVGHLTLVRPEAINALNLTMVRALAATLARWRDDRRVELVLVDGIGRRGFCAGGDIKFVHANAAAHPERVRGFWREEYQLDALLASYPKPVVTVAHGISMGGGVGLASHASHRIVTHSVRLAMPETLIGLCPDVAGLHLLARAPGQLGTHVALTGTVFGSGDAVAMGFADAVVADERLDDLVDRLQRADPDVVLADLHSPDGAAEPVLLPQRPWVDACYRKDTALEILAALRSRPEPEAGRAAETLTRVSPTSATVTLEAIRRAAGLASVRDCLAQDFRISSRFLCHPDLVEGIRARVVDKDRSPRWSPGSLAEVTRSQVASFLAPFDDPAEELALAGVSA